MIPVSSERDELNIQKLNFRHNTIYVHTSTVLMVKGNQTYEHIASKQTSTTNETFNNKQMITSGKVSSNTKPTSNIYSQKLDSNPSPSLFLIIRHELIDGT